MLHAFVAFFAIFLFLAHIFAKVLVSALETLASPVPYLYSGTSTMASGKAATKAIAMYHLYNTFLLSLTQVAAYFIREPLLVADVN